MAEAVLTSRYHAHSHLQRADGLYGGIVIHRPVDKSRTETDLAKYNYDQEKLLLVGDWYHWPAPRVLEWYDKADHFGYEVCAQTKAPSVQLTFTACTRLAPHQWHWCLQLLQGRQGSCSQLYHARQAQYPPARRRPSSSSRRQHGVRHTKPLHTHHAV